jgi:hypothetical protein
MQAKEKSASVIPVLCRKSGAPQKRTEQFFLREVGAAAIVVLRTRDQTKPPRGACPAREIKRPTSLQ